MTSIPPAEPRPPPSINLVSGLPRAHLPRPPPQPSIPNQTNVDQDDDFEIIDSRPVKKRKLSDNIAIPTTFSNAASIASKAQDSHNNTRYSTASWLAITQNEVMPSENGRSKEQSESSALPRRPWDVNRAKNISLEDGRPGCRVRKQVAVPTTPDSMATPDDAPQLEHSKRADYFPWTGKHQEDVLSDNHVKSGYYDRGPNPPEKELNTAKTHLYNAFANRSGLETLSAMFSLLLDEKSGHGTFSSISSFKGPPPRVTLTEAKRKSWITDLASPDIPLRRLSKTIPQGIRGQSLLDQCLLHFVPLNRAIWFAKCVGANEIRTLKRKGITATVAHGAEIKWLKEWTISIEHFIEQVSLQCGQNLWKEQIHYAVQLTMRLYQDNLLDRDHYLDWIVKSFCGAHINYVPFWLMIVNLYKVDLLTYRKRGKQLAEGLVKTYNHFHGEAPEVLQSLSQNLAKTIRSCVTIRISCFLMPDEWLQCEQALRTCLGTDSPAERAMFEHLRIATEQVTVDDHKADSKEAPFQEAIVKILDTARAPYNVADIGSKLSEACSNQDYMLKTCIAWSVSRYRTGVTRMYLVARLLRRWARQGFNIDTLLFNFVYKEANMSSLDLHSLRHLFSELSRSHTFSISKYFQWLIVRGLPRPNSHDYHKTFNLTTADGLHVASMQDSNDPLQLVAEISLIGLDIHVQNTRNTLMSRSGFHYEEETTIIKACQEHWTKSLYSPGADSLRGQSLCNTSRLPWSIRTRLAHWLRKEAVGIFTPSQESPDGDLEVSELNSMKALQFSIIRGALEQMQDITTLADVLRLAAYVKQEDVLATAVDTINKNADTLSAIGAFEPLQNLYCQAYLMLRLLKLSMPLLAIAMIDLCQQYPAKLTPVKALQQDFVRGDRGRAIAACSPFSDGVAESLQQAGATFYDDFEAILQTESNMNEQTMDGLFGVLVDRIAKSHEDQVEEGPASFTLCQLLCRLKLCRRLHGDLLTKKWLTRLTTGGKTSSSLLVNLISTRCLAFEDLVEIFQQATTNVQWKNSLDDLLRLALDCDHLADDYNEYLWYSIKLGAAKMATKKPAEVFEIAVNSVSAYDFGNKISTPLVATLILNPDTVKMLSKQARTALSQELCSVLEEISTAVPAPDQARLLVEATNSFSLPFCQFRMRMICQNPAVKNDDDAQEAITTALLTALDAKDSHLQSFANMQALLHATGSSIGTKLRNNVEQRLFQALPKFLQSKAAVPLRPPTVEENDRAYAVLRKLVAVSTEANIAGHSAGITTLVEKLTIYLRCLGLCTPASNNLPSSPAFSAYPIAPTSAPTPTNGESSHAFLVESLDTLNILLQMVLLNRSNIIPAPGQAPGTVAKQIQQEQIKILGLVISIATHSAWSSYDIGKDFQSGHHRTFKTVISTLFDVAAVLVDDMTDESRHFCARILKDKMKDDRVRWILGSVMTCGSTQYPDAGRGLMMQHDTKGVVGEFKVKVWEMLDGGGGRNDAFLGLGLFEAKKM